MGVSYCKLFKLMIDRKMKKKDLMQAAGISPSSMAKLGRDEYVSLEVLDKICTALQVNIGDVMDVLLETKEQQDQ
jgi:DNA-binding Xre family transcriptional regulator